MKEEGKNEGKKKEGKEKRRKKERKEGKNGMWKSKEIYGKNTQKKQGEKKKIACLFGWLDFCDINPYRLPNVNSCWCIYRIVNVYF